MLTCVRWWCWLQGSMGDGWDLKAKLHRTLMLLCWSMAIVNVWYFCAMKIVIVCTCCQYLRRKPWNKVNRCLSVFLKVDLNLYCIRCVEIWSKMGWGSLGIVNYLPPVCRNAINEVDPLVMGPDRPFHLKHRKNWECWPVSLFIVRSVFIYVGMTN